MCTCLPGYTGDGFNCTGELNCADMFVYSRKGIPILDLGAEAKAAVAEPKKIRVEFHLQNI